MVIQASNAYAFISPEDDPGTGPNMSWLRKILLIISNVIGEFTAERYVSS
jgi:hypothetical protein